MPENMSYNGRIPIHGCVTSVRGTKGHEQWNLQQKRQEESEALAKQRKEQEEFAKILAHRWAEQDRRGKRAPEDDCDREAPRRRRFREAEQAPIGDDVGGGTFDLGHEGSSRDRGEDRPHDLDRYPKRQESEQGPERGQEGPSRNRREEFDRYPKRQDLEEEAERKYEGSSRTRREDRSQDLAAVRRGQVEEGVERILRNRHEDQMQGSGKDRKRQGLEDGGERGREKAPRTRQDHSKSQDDAHPRAPGQREEPLGSRGGTWKIVPNTQMHETRNEKGHAGGSAGSSKVVEKDRKAKLTGIFGVEDDSDQERETTRAELERAKRRPAVSTPLPPPGGAASPSGSAAPSAASVASLQKKVSQWKLGLKGKAATMPEDLRREIAAVMGSG